MRPRAGQSVTRSTLRDLAAEIIRRGDLGSESHVICVSDPPTIEERLQLIAASLQDIPVMITTRHIMTEDEWIERYCTDENTSSDRP
jgi:hypothetical protein